jgi:hypothetical protein
MTILKAVTRTRRALHLSVITTQLAVILAGVITPLLLLTGTASAAQLTTRSVAIGDSTISATSTYVYTYTMAAVTVGSIAYQACTLPLGACVSPGGTININAGATTNTSGWAAGAFTRNNAAAAALCTSAANMLCTARASNAAESSGAHVMTVTTQTNPTALGTFYIRITTFSDIAWVTAVDSGVVAASTANNLTVTAQVQESLTFCVGTTTIDATPGADPGACPIGGTSVNLGTLTAGAHNYSIPRTDSGAPANNGIAELSTNAANGTTISYFANQNGSSGTLKTTAGSPVCAGSTVYATGSLVDACFNDTTTQTTFNTLPLKEGFGMTVAGTNCVHTTAYACTYTSGTNNLKATAPYIGATATTYGTTAGFAWQDNGTTTQIASSSTVVDSEAIILKFDAWPVVTTPTGTYSVSSVYIATSVY